MSRSLNHGFEDECSEETFNAIYKMAFARGINYGMGVCAEKIEEEIEKTRAGIEDMPMTSQEKGLRIALDIVKGL